MADSWYACLHAPTLSSSAGSASTSAAGLLVALAEEFSPRYQIHRSDLVMVDIRGLERLLGHPQRIGEEIRRPALARGQRVNVGIAALRTTAMVMALGRPGLTVVPRGEEADAVAPMAIGMLETMASVETPGLWKSSRNADRKASVDRKTVDPRTADQKVIASAVSAFRRWGMKTLGELASLPADELSARLGQDGLVWQRIARGQDMGPLVPTLADERFESSIELEWPIEGLEPLSFVLTRLLEPLSTRLEARDRGAAAIHLTLGLVWIPDVQAYPPHQSDPPHQPLHVRALQLPSPIREVRALRTLMLLDLESHPPAAPIEYVGVSIDPTPGRVLQHALFVRAHPAPEQLSTLIARLNALMGEDRVGRPACVETYRPGAFAMQPFATEHDHRGAAGVGKSGGTGGSDVSHQLYPPHQSSVVSALRRCRRPVPARVVMADGKPIAVTTDRRGFAGGRVLASSGPWRSSGEWWEIEEKAGGAGTAGRVGRAARGIGGAADAAGGAGEAGEGNGAETGRAGEGKASGAPWNVDEWDVSLTDGGVYRIVQDRDADRWFIDAIVD